MGLGSSCLLGEENIKQVQQVECEEDNTNHQQEIEGEGRIIKVVQPN